MVEAEFITAMSVLELKPGDRVVVKCDRMLAPDMVQRIEAYVGEKLGGVPVLMLDKGFDIGVIREAT